MKTVNYHTSITAQVGVREAIEKINRLPAWWTRDFEGSAQKLDDVFTLRFGDTWVTCRVVDAVADKRLEWEITDCHLPWLADKTEWKNTNLIWEFSAGQDSTQVDFTHVGLIPEVECYDTCVEGWDFYIKESLFKLLTQNQGLPNARQCRLGQETVTFRAPLRL